MAQITNEPVAEGDALELGRFLPYRLSVVSNLVSHDETKPALNVRPTVRLDKARARPV